MLEKESRDLQNKFDEFTNKVTLGNYLMPFGKYKGEFVADIYQEDRDYFDWLYDKADGQLKEAMTFIKGEK